MNINPCYDPVTKTDCPRRTLGCHGSCEDWAGYVAARNEKYTQRINDNETFDIIHSKRIRQSLRYISRRGKSGRTK